MAPRTTNDVPPRSALRSRCSRRDDLNRSPQHVGPTLPCHDPSGLWPKVVPINPRPLSHPTPGLAHAHSRPRGRAAQVGDLCHPGSARPSGGALKVLAREGWGSRRSVTPTCAALNGAAWPALGESA